MFDSWQHVQRVLIYMPRVSIPILENVRQTLPHAAIALMTCHQQELPLWVDDVINYEPNFSDPQSEIAVIEQLKSKNFEAAIIFSSPQTPYCVAYMCYLAGIPIRVARSPEFGGSVLSHCLPTEGTQDLDLLKLIANDEHQHATS